MSYAAKFWYPLSVEKYIFIVIPGTSVNSYHNIYDKAKLIMFAKTFKNIWKYYYSNLKKNR